MLISKNQLNTSDLFHGFSADAGKVGGSLGARGHYVNHQVTTVIIITGYLLLMKESCIKEKKMERVSVKWGNMDFC